MNDRMEELLEQLEKSESIERMAGVENEIAAMLGKGFLEGSLDYTYLTQIKERVEQTERECRTQFEKENQVQEKRPARSR
ncbi:MAG: hypothetical protein J6K53_10540 [Roseburia sp.]|nr:hypothetical protein [Roseburia sp.]